MSSPRLFSKKKTQAGKPPKKSFRQLFSRDELVYYGVAAVVYIILGLLVQELILNWVVGPLFIVAWMWWVPPFIEKRRGQ